MSQIQRDASGNIAVHSTAPSNFLANIKPIEIDERFKFEIPMNDGPTKLGGMLGKAFGGVNEFLNKKGSFGPFKEMTMGDRFKKLGQGFMKAAASRPKYDSWRDYKQNNRWGG